MIDGTGAYAGMSLDERRALAESTFLPRPRRTLESAQYTLDAKLDVPWQWRGEHTTVLGTQVIRGELEDGVFGMEDGAPSAVQDHNMHSLFTLNARINNLLDEDFTTYDTEFDDLNGDGDYLDTNETWTPTKPCSSSTTTTRTSRGTSG